MGLTALEVGQAKGRGELYRLYDGMGSSWSTPTGAKRWRVKYRLYRRERRLSLGLYLAVSLGLARDWYAKFSPA